jgi:hypothetical protein
LWQRRREFANQNLEDLIAEVDAVASSVLQATVEVHRVLGPGSFERIYESYGIDRA